MQRLLIVLALVGNGCSCSQNNEHMGTDDLAGNFDLSNQEVVPDLAMNPDALAGGDLVVTPDQITLDIYPGMPAPLQAYTAKVRQSGMDVTTMATFTLDDTSLGSFSGNTLTANMKAGTTLVHASWQGLTGYTTVHFKLHATNSDNCPGCPAFPPDTTPACSAMSSTPTILYPPNGILVPPNMNVMSTQFDQGMGNTLFEIDYQNAITDMRVLTKCTPITDSKKSATNGCIYELSQDVWDFLANNNRGGDPVNIIVRATDASGSCIATSSSMISISFGEEDLNGGIYYWQSIAVTGLQGATGGIFRYDFGKRGQTAQPFLAPTSTTNARCIGCHFLSRDGAKMTYGNDDPDADDEYSDLNNFLIDVSTKTNKQILTKAGGFQAFAPDHSLFVATDGTGGTMKQGTVTANANDFFLFDGNTGVFGTPSLIPTGGARATHPDWSPDGTQLVFVKPGGFAFAGNNRIDDNHFYGGSLYTMSFSGGSFGTPAPLLTSMGENNYYPAFSPDGKFVIFNQVPLTGTANACTTGACANDAFSNPAARVFLMPASGGTPIDLAHLNDSGAIGNSWPRFAPNVQTYKGHQIAWVTFSSVRDYGDVVRNSVMVNGAAQKICYPPESPENASTNKNVTTDPSCNQPQLWMAAIDLTSAAAGADASFPAFWLPFQDSTSHNHIAQWVTTLVGPPAPDGGVPDAAPPACIPGTGACTAGDYCCNGICCGDNTCGCIP